MVGDTWSFYNAKVHYTFLNYFLDDWKLKQKIYVNVLQMFSDCIFFFFFATCNF